MSVSYRRFAPLLLVSFTFAACQDQFVAPEPGGSVDVPPPQFAQGDGGVWTVTTLDYLGDGTCDEASCTLREAIGAASNDDTIVFAAGLQGDIELPNVLPPPADYGFVIEDRLTIDGDGRIEIDGNGLVRVLHVDGTSGDTEPVPVTLKGLTIKNGRSLTGGAAGISVSNGAVLTLDHTTVADNMAVGTAGQGGGISVSSSSALTVINSTVTGNEAYTGGGIFVNGSVEIIASTIASNQAVDGGGLYLDQGSTGTVERSTFSGNLAGVSDFGQGGGIHNKGILEIRSSTIVGNIALGLGSDGGGLYADFTTTLANTIVAGNAAGSGDNCSQSTSIDLESLGHNMAETESPCALGKPGDILLSEGQVFTQVLEEALGDNGGPTQTHALLARGRAVDKGYCPGESLDQRGFGRPVDDGLITNALDACDIGAYEIQGPFVAHTDLMVSQSADKTSAKQGELLTYTVRVRNLGPETAPNAILTNVLSSGVTFVSAAAAKGNFTAPPAGETGTVTWYLGDLLDQANETAEIKVTVRIKGKATITNTASVTSDATDPNEANNTASLTTSVASGGTKPPGKGK